MNVSFLGSALARVPQRLVQRRFRLGSLRQRPLVVVLCLGWMMTAGAAEQPITNHRPPKDDNDLIYWLQNMAWHHGFTQEEMAEATGLEVSEVQRALSKFQITPQHKPKRPANARLLVLPYPGGRHPRTGFLDGAVHPQRETKVSVFMPWDETSYVVVDVPEAIWSNLGLLYLAHTHVPTVWTRKNMRLEPREWMRRSDESLEIKRTLPNGIAFGAKVKPTVNAVRMELWLQNGSTETLRDLRVQNCVMLKAVAGFNQQTNANKLFTNSFAVCKSADGRRWIVTAWEPIYRVWGNVPVPCLHADPKFPDCGPGETQRLQGWLSFYEGTEIESELKRIQSTGWWKKGLD